MNTPSEESQLAAQRSTRRNRWYCLSMLYTFGSIAFIAFMRYDDEGELISDDIIMIIALQFICILHAPNELRERFCNWAFWFWMVLGMVSWYR